MIFFDTETCGLHGPIVLYQYAIDDGPINMHDIWLEPARTTIELFEQLCFEDVVGFNLAFDWFHVCQMYTTMILLSNIDDPPDPVEYALLEPLGRYGPCLKPRGALDLMLHARKGPYQSTMPRADIVIKRVPTALAWELQAVLNDRIKLNDLYFAKKQDYKKRWGVDDIEEEPEFKNIILRFAPSSALKALATDALGVKSPKLFSDVEPPSKSMPEESGWAPFALAHGNTDNWNGAWPDAGKIMVHIEHWATNQEAREYAMNDVKYTRMLYEHFKRPAANDEDSILACMVGAVRWRGFNINLQKIQVLKEKKKAVLDNAPIDFNSVRVCRTYLEEVLNDTEKLAVMEDGKVSTRAIILEEVSKWRKEDVCTECNGFGCMHCEEGLIKSEEKHPAARRAAQILEMRRASKEIELYDKLLQAGRFHASFNVIGTLSNRMSGSDGLNAQGIKRDKEVRECFQLSDMDMILCGGDFESFEVTLMDAVYSDPDLRADLKSGKKIHGLFGSILFNIPYEEVLKTKGLPGDRDKYTRAKNGVFALAYGGEAYTLVNRVGVDEKTANEAYQKWVSKYVVWGKERQRIFDMFCSMRQPGGIGTEVQWSEPADYIESMFGFKRYFTLENQICSVLYELGTKLPKRFSQLKLSVTRRDRVQTAGGAVRSALFAAAFALQAANMRAAGNHVIQSSGATLTKRLQCRIWGIQPHGIHTWCVVPFNVHDELMVPAKPEYVEQINTIVSDFITENRAKVPLLDISWHDDMASWAEK